MSQASTTEPRTAEEWAEQVDRELVAIYYDEAGEKKIERLAAFFRLAMAQARAEGAAVEREACAGEAEAEVAHVYFVIDQLRELPPGKTCFGECDCRGCCIDEERAEARGARSVARRIRARGKP